MFKIEIRVCNLLFQDSRGTSEERDGGEQTGPAQLSTRGPQVQTGSTTAGGRTEGNQGDTEVHAATSKPLSPSTVNVGVPCMELIQLQ